MPLVNFTENLRRHVDCPSAEVQAATVREALSGGLPSESWDLIYGHALDVDGSGERLAMGSTTGNFWISEDAGERWTHVSGHLPPIVQVAWG